MNVYPLAIYTADHGLSWNFPQEEISFQEIDACRKALGQLPDFDSGVKGFDGVWAKGNRVFVMRCQSVAAWDFRGRNATYLAVTWIPRADANRTDFDKLLNSEAMSVPTKSPPMFFNVDAETVSADVVTTSEPYLPDGFLRVGAIIAGVPPETTVAVKRISGNSQASLTISDPVDYNGHCPAAESYGKSSQLGVTAQTTSSSALMVLLAVWFFTASATAVLWFKWQATVRQNSEISAELTSAKSKISELESENKGLLEEHKSFLDPRCIRLCPNHRARPYESYYLLWEIK